MISSIVKKRTFDSVMNGAKVITFEDKPHWQKRLTPFHRAIVLLSGGRCRCFRVECIEKRGTEFRVHLGGVYTWPRQQGLFDE